MEGATSFCVDSTTAPGRNRLQRLDDKRLLQAVGLEPDNRDRALRPVAGLEAALELLGSTVLSVDLYSEDGWVAGVSDWGEEIDALFGPKSWTRLSSLIASISPPPVVALAEAVSRPAFRPGNR
jgi:hypothetical protein